MDWIFLPLIVGAIGYMGKIAVDYTSFSTEIQPLIAGLEQDAVEVAEQAQYEVTRTALVRERIPELHTLVVELQEKLGALKGKIGEQQKLKKRLETATFKQKLRKGRRS